MDFRNSAHTLEGGNEGRKERKAKKTMQRRHCESWIPSINLQIHFLPFSSSACLLNGYCACTEQHSEKTRMCMESKSSLHPISNLPSPTDFHHSHFLSSHSGECCTGVPSYYRHMSRTNYDYSGMVTELIHFKCISFPELFIFLQN